jgi:hypothetical protein
MAGGDDERRGFRVRVRPSGASRAAAFAVRIDVAHAETSSSVSIDFLAVQLLGHCGRPDARSFLTDDGGEERTVVADEAGASNACVLASEPYVIAAGVALVPGQTSSFLVRCDALPTGAPPSFDGKAVCCEYLLLVTARTMAPQARGWWASWSSDQGESWSRGSIRRLRVPLHMDQYATPRQAAAARPAPGEPLRCNLRCTELRRTTIRREPVESTNGRFCSGVGSGVSHDDGGGGDDDDDADDADADDDDGDGDGDGDGGDDAGSGDGSGDGGDEHDVGELSLERRRFRLQLDASPVACVEFVSAAFHVGGALRGAVQLNVPTVRVTLALLLEEAERSAAAGLPQSSAAAPAAPSRTVAKVELSCTPHVHTASFELAIPAHLPPSCTLRTVDALVELRWVALLTFELCTAGAPAPLPWRLPVRVLAAPRRPRGAALRERLAAPGLTQCWEDGVQPLEMHLDGEH